MGMASSQVRLLAITNRMHDIEYKAQCLQNAKLRLAMDEDEAYQKYQAILDATTLTVKAKDGTTWIPGTFNNLMANGKEISGGAEFAFIDQNNDTLIVPQNIYEEFKKNPTRSAEALALSMVGEESFDPYKQFGAGKPYEAILSGSTNVSKKLYDGNGGGILDQMVAFLQKNGDHVVYRSDDYDTDRVDEEQTENLKTFLENHKEANADNVNAIIKALFAAKNEATEEGFLMGGDIGLNAIEFDTPKMQEDWELLCKRFDAQVVTESKSRIFGDDDEKRAEFEKYLTIFRMVKTHAGNNPEKVVSINNYNSESTQNNAQEDSNWLQDQLLSGRFTISTFKYNSSKYEGTLTGTSVATDTKLNYTQETSLDKTKLAAAEAEYEHTLKQIDKKDKQYDTELSKLEAERKALDTEREGIKKVMEDNVDRTFGLFS